MKEFQEETNVCNECGTPLISTFMFMGAEFYCTGCGRSYGIFDKFGIVPLTSELKEKMIKLRKEFDSISCDIMTGGFRLGGCEKCEKQTHGKYHQDHLTDEEIRLNDLAWKKLEQMKIKEVSDERAN